jgi:phage-related minor tail protein
MHYLRQEGLGGSADTWGVGAEPPGRPLLCSQDAKAAKAAALKIRQLETKVSKLQDNLAKEQAKVAAGAGSAGATKDMERQHKREMTALEKKLAAAEASVAASTKAAEKSALRELHDQNRSSD